jgi:hypothetical protein
MSNVALRTLVTDDFNRANNLTSLGTGWVTSTGYNTCGVSSNQCAPVNGTAVDYSLDSADDRNDVTWPNDHWAEAKVFGAGTSGGGTGFGVLVRSDGFAISRYYALVSETDTVTLTKVVANTFTNIWIRSATFSPGDRLRLEVQGTTLRVYINGVQVGADTTDSALSAGNTGVLYSSSLTGALLDDWAAGDFIVGGVVISGLRTRMPRNRRSFPAFLD